MNDSSFCETNNFPRQRTKSLGCEIGSQGLGKKSFILQQNLNNNKIRQRQLSSGVGGVRKANSFYTTTETKLSVKKSSPSWMTKREIPLIVVSSDDTPMNRIQKIRKHRSMPQLIHGRGGNQTSSSSEEDYLFNKEERMRIKSTILDIPFYENNNKIESIDQTPDSIYCSSTQEGEDENVTVSSSSDTNLMEPNYTEDIDDDHQAMLVIAEKKIITPSYTVSRSIKPRIVFIDELNKWRENNSSSSTEQEEKKPTEKEVLISNQSKSISIDLPYSRSIAATEDYTSDEIYERLKPLSSNSNQSSSSTDHWKRLSFNNKRKMNIIPPPATYGDSQDSRVETLMTPEPCEFQKDKESPSFPKRFSDDPLRRTMLSIKKKERTSFEKEKGKVKKPPSLLKEQQQQQQQLIGTFTDGWNRSPLTPKSSQFFTEMNPDNNLKDVLAAWEVLHKEGEEKNQSATRRRSMTVGNLPRFEEIQEAERINNGIVHLDKSLGLDYNSTDEPMRKRSSTISKGKQWFFNRKRENEIKKDIKEFKPHATEQTSEILPSSWVRQSLMENETMINGLDDIINAPIKIEPRHSFTQEARRIYFQNQAKEEQRRKVELENLDMLIAWGQISIDEKEVRESIFEENRKNKDLSALFGGDQTSKDSSVSTTKSNQGGKLIRKTASDKSTLHQRFISDTFQHSSAETVMGTKPLENITRKSSMNPFKTQKQNKPPPIPKKPSISKLKKESTVTNDVIPASQKVISHHQRINSLVNESLSETPRSIASISPIDNKPINNEQQDHELELDAFLIEVDRTFRTRDTLRKFHKNNNNFQTPTSTPPQYQSLNETNHKQQININSKSNRRNSLSQIFKWKSIKVDDQQNIQTKHHSNHYSNQIPQTHINSTMKLHQRSRSNLIQLFARHKNE